jgi:hypothetical protein
MILYLCGSYSRKKSDAAPYGFDTVILGIVENSEIVKGPK